MSIGARTAIFQKLLRRESTALVDIGGSDHINLPTPSWIITMSFDYADLQRRVAVMATTAAKLRPRDRDEAGLLGTFVGILYALNRAAELGYDGKRHDDATAMKDEFLDVARHLSQSGAVMPKAWQAGFYFTDVVFRLEALGTRMQRVHPDKKDYFKAPAPAAIRSMKQGANLKKKVAHVQVGGHPEWSADLGFALQAAEYVCNELVELLALKERLRTPLA